MIQKTRQNRDPVKTITVKNTNQYVEFKNLKPGNIIQLHSVSCLLILTIDLSDQRDLRNNKFYIILCLNSKGYIEKFKGCCDSTVILVQ